MGQESARVVKVRYLDVGDPVSLLVAEAFHGEEMSRAKDAALARLGITRRPGESHLQAWLRAMAEENGVPHRVPADPRLVDAVLASPGARRFLWWLAGGSSRQ